MMWRTEEKQFHFFVTLYQFFLVLLSLKEMRNADRYVIRFIERYKNIFYYDVRSVYVVKVYFESSNSSKRIYKSSRKNYNLCLKLKNASLSTNQNFSI